MLAVHLTDALLPIILELQFSSVESVAEQRRRDLVIGDLIHSEGTAGSLYPITIDSSGIARLG